MKSTGLVLGMCLWLVVRTVASADAAPLDLDEVFQSVGNHYPLLAAALEEQAVADGELTSKQGAFDFVV